MAAAVAGNFETQAREAFRQLDLTLNSAGGSLVDVVHHDGYGSEALMMIWKYRRSSTQWLQA